MVATIEDILSSVCSTVERISSNKKHDVYLLGDAKEAKLVYDALAAQGIELKFYNEGSRCKLYVIKNAMEPTLLASKLRAAQSYLQILRPIKQLLDSYGASDQSLGNYNLTFSKSLNGAQIGIHITNPTSAEIPVIKPQLKPKRTPEEHADTAMQKNEKIIEIVSDEGIFTAGPEMLKQFKKQAKATGMPLDDRKANPLQRLFALIASNSIILLVIIAVITALFMIGTTAKGFLCPDLATTKNKAWYCMSDEDQRLRPQ